MSYRHKELSAGGWNRIGFTAQMANIGSEIERALNWKAKNNPAYSQQAFERALELMDLTLDSARGLSRLKEVARAREAAADYFSGSNEYGSSEESWRNYFAPFIYAARKSH